MEDKKQVVVYGGCFNPPLNSHFSLADQLLNEYEVIEKVVFMPVGDFYRDTVFYKKDSICDAEHRYNMLKLVCDKNEKFEVSRLEIDAENQLTTYETLKILSEQSTNYEVCFLMGSDNLKEIENWRNAEKLVSEYKIYLLERDKDDISQIINESEFLTKYKDNFVRAKENITSNVSSTYVRKKIREGKSVRYLVPDEVFYYIDNNKLYKD